MALTNPGHGCWLDRSYLVFARMADLSGRSINIRHKEMARQLINAGANINAADKNGYTPLDATTGEQFSDGKSRRAIAELLRQRGGKSRDEQVKP